MWFPLLKIPTGFASETGLQITKGLVGKDTEAMSWGSASGLNGVLITSNAASQLLQPQDEVLGSRGSGLKILP